jgi:hypothetical protein
MWRMWRPYLMAGAHSIWDRFVRPWHLLVEWHHADAS